MSNSGDSNAPRPRAPRPRSDSADRNDSSSSDSPVGHANRRSRSKRRLPTHPRAPDPSLRLVLDELAVLKGEMAKLKANPQATVGDGTVQAAAASRLPSPANFSGFGAESQEEGEIIDTTPRGSVLRKNAIELGPPDTVSVDIDDQVAGMVNYLFDNGMQDEDYKVISEDMLTTRPKNCPALAPVDCNPQILDALKTDARKADARLKDVCGDILKAGTVLTKSLLALDKVAQETAHPVVEQEVNNINAALALLGHANHKNNLARRFVMKREINQKYSHLCSDKLPMSRLLFGDDVSQATRQIEESEKLRHKIAVKKTAPVPWRFTSGRSRGFWGRTIQRNYAPRFQPYGMFRGARSGRHQQPRPDQESKNSRGRGFSRPRH